MDLSQSLALSKEHALGLRDGAQTYCHHQTSGEGGQSSSLPCPYFTERARNFSQHFCLFKKVLAEGIFTPLDMVQDSYGGCNFDEIRARKYLFQVRES